MTNIMNEANDSPKIYFAGSIRGGRDDQATYATLIEHMQDRGVEVLCEHVGLKDLTDQGNDQDTKFIHDRDLGWLDEPDGMVAEVTNPSLGVGYEIKHAIDTKKPVLALFSRASGRKLSAMIEGADEEFVWVVKYSQLFVAKVAIDTFLQSRVGHK